jgi:hypothetical protein
VLAKMLTKYKEDRRAAVGLPRSGKVVVVNRLFQL